MKNTLGGAKPTQLVGVESSIDWRAGRLPATLGMTLLEVWHLAVWCADDKWEGAGTLALLRSETSLTIHSPLVRELQSPPHCFPSE